MIASANRPRTLHDTVMSLRTQQYYPAAIIISAPEGDHVLAATAALPDVRIVRSEAGLTRQRNRAVAALADGIEIVAFLDDDVELRDDYLTAIMRAFRERPATVFLRGHMVVNGLACDGSERRRARALLEADMRTHGGATAPLQLDPITPLDAFGATMSVRRWVFRSIQFDERLPLYGYMEDLDFAAQCARLGQLAYCHNARLVHFFAPGGRIPGARMGFSQVMNPVYLWTKGTVSSPLLLRVVARHLVANAVKSLMPAQSIVRRDRFAGNMRAMRRLLTGHVAPEEC